MPDSRRVLYLSTNLARNAARVNEIWSTSIDGSAPPALIARIPRLQIATLDVTSSGRFALFTVLGDTTNPTDIYYAELSSPAPRAVALANTRFTESGPVISPDERWLAYASNETGASAIYVRSFPGDGPRVLTDRRCFP